MRGRAPLAVAMTASARPNKVLTPRTTVARSKSGVFGRNIMYFIRGVSDHPNTGAPQARLDPPPRTALRRRLVSILHPGRPCAAGSSRSASRVESSAWAPALGSHCGLRGRLRHRRAARSEPIVHCRWCHAPRLSVLLARAASSASRVPSARGAPLGLAAPPPPCTLAHASASASADRLSWATSRLQLGANLAADRTGRVFGVVSPVRVPCAVCCATR